MSLIKDLILRQAKKRKEIVYGAQAINAQMPGYMHRKTEDYDVYSHKPKVSAYKLEKTLDKAHHGNKFYVKPAKHPGTWKVMKYKGEDNVADYTTMPQPPPKHKTIGGVRYVTLTEVSKSKKVALKDKESKFRHEKDRGDLERIRFEQRMRRI